MGSRKHSVAKLVHRERKAAKQAARESAHRALDLPVLLVTLGGGFALLAEAADRLPPADRPPVTQLLARWRQVRHAVLPLGERLEHARRIGVPGPDAARVDAATAELVGVGRHLMAVAKRHAIPIPDLFNFNTERGIS